jgi:chromosomal replication initiator protein
MSATIVRLSEKNSYTVAPGIDFERITIERILRTTCDYFQQDQERVLGKGRYRELCVCRFITMFLSKKYTQLSLKTIGESLGGRDHTTAIHAINTVKDLMETDPSFRFDVEVIEKSLYR